MKNLVSQLESERRRVDFDTFDISVKELVSMARQQIINVAPEYQRQFRWPEKNQSQFIESVFLGIPIPSLFMAANKDGTWELIDGVQRLTSLIHFVGEESDMSQFNLNGKLILEKLSVLTEFNGISFNEIPQTIQLKFLLRPLKVTTLSDKSDLKVRFDLFERLNTGGIRLSEQEIRACVYRGRFNDFLSELAKNDDFNAVVNLPLANENDGSRLELVLKFFAYYYERESFDHSVVGFLNDYMEKSTAHFNYKEAKKLFEDTFSYLRGQLPNGIRRGNRTITPINLYEAISVGAADCISLQRAKQKSNVSVWINDKELISLTSGATNSRKRLNSRINYCRERFLK